ncbi:hypothetical protein EXIGLDRAFT_599245 [Exidia glandulosa HHB12029]|uniref:Restriction of telomere capping protein 4 n=1 Tax=Exidia glandulosa HHB12029 TaxID=1314781 RepID=A0A165R0G0_EXIGL|nr:hypothetical protein EXIGLDRAFT_599245 [Exidia glandulosa HHB12029]
MAVGNVVKLGARAAESAMGQYAVFDKEMPGYYGERGSMVLHRAVLGLYPDGSVEGRRGVYAPLTARTFFVSVLIPEAALALIMADTGDNRAGALKTMRDSSNYGMLQFPDEDDEQREVGQHEEEEEDDDDDDDEEG